MTAEQLAQKDEKKKHKVTLPIVKSSRWRGFGFGFHTFCCQPWIDEHIKVNKGEFVTIWREDSYWMYGEKVSCPMLPMHPFFLSFASFV